MKLMIFDILEISLAYWNKFLVFKPLSVNPQKWSNNMSAVADEVFEYVCLFCEVDN